VSCLPTLLVVLSFACLLVVKLFLATSTFVGAIFFSKPFQYHLNIILDYRLFSLCKKFSGEQVKKREEKVLRYGESQD